MMLLSAFLRLVRREPALVAGVLQALLAVFVAFGVPLTDGQVAAVLGLAAAVCALAVRSSVTPTLHGRHVRDSVGTPHAGGTAAAPRRFAKPQFRPFTRRRGTRPPL